MPTDGTWSMEKPTRSSLILVGSKKVRNINLTWRIGPPRGGEFPACESRCPARPGMIREGRESAIRMNRGNSILAEQGKCLLDFLHDNHVRFISMVFGLTSPSPRRFSLGNDLRTLSSPARGVENSKSRVPTGTLEKSPIRGS